MYMNTLTVDGYINGTPRFFPGPGGDHEKDRVYGELVAPSKPDDDPLNFVAWGKIARAISQYCRSGKRVVVQGQIRMGVRTPWPILKVDNIAFGPDAYYNKPGKAAAKAHQQFDRVVGKLVEEGVKPHFQQWTTKSAYEANKKSEVCVVCGKKLQMHPSVGVKYCKCIEQLP